MNNLRKLIFIFILSFGSVSFLSHDNNFENIRVYKKILCSEEQRCLMTVFIHGTTTHRFLLKSLAEWLKREWAENFLNKILWKKSEKEKTKIFNRYKNWINIYTEKVDMSGFCSYQPIGQVGLTKICRDNCINRCSREYVGVQTSILYEKVYDEVYKNHKNIFAHYSYDWSGALSSSKRLDASRELYLSLIKESKALYDQYGLPVEINLLGHSHGSNVILNLAQIEQEFKQNLFIDKAILFAGPIQSETERFVNSDIFGKVYNIYSTGDYIQICDFISTKDFGSRRTFGSDKKNKIKIKDNLRQIEVKIGDYKPSHYELWLWGGSGLAYFLYRKTLPFHPLPVSIFSPLITALSDSLDMKSDKNKSCQLYFYKDRDWFLMTGGSNGVLGNFDVKSLKAEGLRMMGLS